MLVEEAQREMRTVYLNGVVGAGVAGTLWLTAAALGTWGSPGRAIWTLVIGGAFIFPVMTLVLRLMGRPASLRHENPLGALAMQIAFTVPLALPVIAGATAYKTNWFFPAFMVIVGAHYMPFVFLYGMWEFWLLAGLLIFGGVWVGMTMSQEFAIGGWMGAASILLFGVIVWMRRGRAEAVSTAR